MNNIRLVTCLPVLVLFLFVTPVIGSSDWVEYMKYDNGSVYSYQKVKMKQKTRDIVRVWDKQVFGEVGKNIVVQHMRNIGSNREWEKLSYSISLFEIDCTKNKLRLLKNTDYDRYSNVIMIDPVYIKHWEEISPDTRGDTLRKKVCK